MKPDIDIARAATAKPIGEIGERLGIPDDALLRFGPDKAKISLDFLETLEDRSGGKLILVTAISPTTAGEGKTTTTVGLGDALNRLGKDAMICLREPSLGPCFGMKGGAAGGGMAQVIPMEDINLHFTGDFHAIGAANNLLAALIDNHIYWGNKLGLDDRRISWRRVVDMNDRALREIVSSLGGVPNGSPREAGFDITVASEVMAVFCLANNLEDLDRRLAKIIVGQTREREFVHARALDAPGAMTVLLKDAFMPNLVQTLEHNPALIHGGPFANIAHGCNSVIATRSALKLADYVVTEAGFGADLGAEKFFDIKCRKAQLVPDAVVMVATVRALKLHGGADAKKLDQEDLSALEKGMRNLVRHVENIKKFKVPLTVAINRFAADSDAEIALVLEKAKDLGVKAFECTHHSNGGAGAAGLAEEVVRLADGGGADFAPLYDDDMPLWDKMETIARELYGADEVAADTKVRAQVAEYQTNGYGEYPICMAKTQYSFSTDPRLKGAPSNHVVPVREVRLANGAEFLVAVCGDIMTMPGLPRVPSASAIHLDGDGLIQGLF
jgi:formate--tetrahydrofolate ligase